MFSNSANHALNKGQLPVYFSSCIAHIILVEQMMTPHFKPNGEQTQVWPSGLSTVFLQPIYKLLFH